MNDQELRVTPTNPGDEYQGAVAGVDVPLFAWVGLALLAGFGVFAWLFYRLELGFIDAVQWAALLPVAAVAYLRLFHQGKPPGYARDLLDSLLTGGEAKPPRRHPRRPTDHV